jgi:hypothetical protein
MKMTSFETIAVFTFPGDLVIAKTKLESEGIECRVLDELTVQSYNFLSNAVGGVKLQVPKSEFDRAYSILLQGGFIKEQKVDQLNYVEKKLSDSSFYKKIKTLLIVFTCIFVVFIFGLFINFYMHKPTVYERLVGENWCLDHVVYANEVFYPYTMSSKIGMRFLSRCDESLIFDSTGVIQIPGFNSEAIIRNWSHENNLITISKYDTIGSVFDGVYRYEIAKNELTMISDSVEIVCVKPFRF